MSHTLTVTCRSGHRQWLTFFDESREAVERIAAILDGTSSLYVRAPGTDSFIGRCGFCGRPYTCVVEDRPPEGEPSFDDVHEELNLMAQERAPGDLGAHITAMAAILNSRPGYQELWRRAREKVRQKTQGYAQ